MIEGHDRTALGAYALRALDPAGDRAVDEHLAGCPDCRTELADLTALQDQLAEVPPEAFLDGPPEDGDLLLQRTLRQARAESDGGRRRVALLTAGVAVLVAGALGGGIAIGQHTGGRTAPRANSSATPAPSGSPSTSSLPPGTRTLATTDPATGATMTVALIPYPGWVGMKFTVKGLPAGTRCELRVIRRSGAWVLAGGWQVTPEEARTGITAAGTAMVDPSDVASIDLTAPDGRRIISVPA